MCDVQSDGVFVSKLPRILYILKLEGTSVTTFHYHFKCRKRLQITAIIYIKEKQIIISNSCLIIGAQVLKVL